jgi:hypothetical protein
MKKLFLLAILPLVAFLGACTPHVPMEDDPDFDCHTMGNGICGPVSITQGDKTLHAANGDFPYLFLQGFADGVCVYGDNPLTPAQEGDTALGCMPLDRVH